MVGVVTLIKLASELSTASASIFGLFYFPVSLYMYIYCARSLVCSLSLSRALSRALSLFLSLNLFLCLSLSLFC